MKNIKILVPYNFTDTARAGLKSAVNISQNTPAEIILLNIINETAPQASLEPSGDMQARAMAAGEHARFIKELMNKRNEEFKNLINQFESRANLTSQIEVGLFSEGLKSYLKDNHVDLIVMGTSGETALSEFFKGNHAAQAIRKTELPVLTVKKGNPVKSLDKFLLLVDMKDYDRKQVAPIRKLTELFNMKAMITHVVEGKTTIEDQPHKKLEAFASEHGFGNYSIHVLDKGDVVDQVRNFIDRENIPMVATLSEGDSGLIRLFTGSDTEDMIENLEVPVLSVVE